MTPKEKAEELFYKYFDLYIDNYTCKKCELIAVDEILDTLESIDDGQTQMPYKYWNEVKQEIEKL